RAAARHSLDDRKGEALVQGREDEELRELIGEMDALVRHESREHDVAQIPVPEAAGPQIRLHPPADDDERQLSAPLPIDAVRADEPLVVAARILRHPAVPRVIRARDRQYEVRRQAVLRTEPPELALVPVRRE